MREPPEPGDEIAVLDGVTKRAAGHLLGVPGSRVSGVCLDGDTTSREAVSELASGVCTLVANVPLRQRRQRDDLPAPTHCTHGTLDAAEVARDAGARRLVLAHLTQSLIDERDEVLEEIAQVYDGEVILAEELMSIEV